MIQEGNIVKNRNCGGQMLGVMNYLLIHITNNYIYVVSI